MTSTDPPRLAAPSKISNAVAEVRSSAHMLTLQPGLYCISVAERGKSGDQAGLRPTTRVSAPPGLPGDPHDLAIVGLPSSEWLEAPGQAMLVRTAQRNTRILLTSYLPRGDATATPPKLHIQRIGDIADLSTPVTEGLPAKLDAAVPLLAPAQPSISAHLQDLGDVQREFGDWVGTPGSGRWIEGFSISPPAGMAAEDLEYQVVLGRGWLSPWIQGGGYCGSRGMSLPALGLRLRLSPAAAARYACQIEATFGDGTRMGPFEAGTLCEAPSLAPLESFRILFAVQGLDPAEAASANVVLGSRRTSRRGVRAKL
ncbi:hypothetical protein ACLF3G_26225 [Falsiroseomonas sp. HC035]|uniref:hypothetical protein n=1 Tax=Falsiroseomonas sp. HC035 TaxID=3390999 RepID=UPI003D323401